MLRLQSHAQLLSHVVSASDARTARVVIILSASSAMRKFANEVIISVEFSSCSWALKWSEEAMIVRVTLGLMLPANNVRCWS